MNQRSAVFNAVTSVLGTTEFNGKVELSKEQKQKVHELLVHGFVNGEIEYRGSADEAEFKRYVPGLVNNWLRKDKRLNGDVKYQPKNPGSRAGSGDDSLKAMKALLGITEDPEKRNEIEKAIEARKAELKPRPNIKVEALPPNLRHMVPEHLLNSGNGGKSKPSEQE